MRIIFQTGTPRNEECGDWQRDEHGNIIITVSAMPLKSFVAVAVHELIEMLKCEEVGISDEQVTQFDAQFLAECVAGKHPVNAESGNSPSAPYHQQHLDATRVERVVLSVLGLSWEEHEKNVDEAFATALGIT